MPKDVCTVELPESGTTQTINLIPNQVNALSFPRNCIVGDPKLNADGSVTIDLINGSNVVIENFQDIADNSSGDNIDTIIQLSDNAVIYPEKLYSQLVASSHTSDDSELAAVAPAAGEEASSFDITTLNAPVDGSSDMVVQAGQEYKFNFDLSDVQSMTQEGSNLVLTFAEGNSLTMINYFTVADGALPPVMTLSDGSVVDAASLLPTYLSSKSGEDAGEGDLASLSPEGTVIPAEAAIEPAAGEEQTEETALEVAESTIIEEAPSEDELASAEEATQETKEVEVESTVENNTDLANLAEQLAEIEPAAGETGANGSRGGFGFQSSTDDVPLNAQPAIGPHGYTALNYVAPEFIDEPFAERENTPDEQFNPPSFSIPSLVVKEDSSINVVIDAPSTGANDILAIEIDVPLGWSVVNLNGGLYDAGTGIWSFITLPGQPFLGGPEVAPPADSDIDSEVLDVTVTRTDTITNQSSVATDTYTILTDAVADTPDLAGTGGAGEEGTIIPITITTSTTDVDGSEIIAVIKITNVPAGMTLTAGTEVAPGEWELDVADLVGLGINVPDGSVGSYTLLVESVADEDPVTDGEFDPTDNQASNFTELVIRVTPDDIPKPVDAEKSLDETDLPVPGPLTVGGTLTVNYGTDGPGTITPNAANTFTVNGSVAGGTLSSNGSPITVTLGGNTYTGTAADGRDIFTMTVNSNGTYTFELLDSLDHADETSPNDVIDLHFSYQAQDNEGDTVDGLITIHIADDAPIAVDDTDSLSDVETVTTGNVRNNDSDGEDTPATITEVQFNGVTVTVPAVGTVSVTGDYGVLDLAADGSYTYTRSTDNPGVDVFTYTLVDFDGDVSKADLTITLADADEQPVISKGFEVVDETDLPGVSESGQLIVDFGNDGPGTVVGNDNFNSSGSQLGGALTSNGQPVTVELVGDTYIGSINAGVDTIFTLQINPDGSYTFDLLGTLDHADPNDPNDIINLEFGVDAIDADQDTTPTTITVLVKDDVPTIGNSYGDVDETNFDTGNLIYSDTLFTDFGTEAASFAPDGNVRAEVGGVPFVLTSEGEPVTLVQTATGYEGTTPSNGTVFTLVMDFTTGQYVYTQTATFDHPDGTDHNDTIELLFDFTVENNDGDSDTGTVVVSVADDGPIANDDLNGAAEGQDITGSVVANDDFSEDNPNIVTQFEFGGNTYNIPAGGSQSVVTTLGTFTLNSDGSYAFDAVDNGDPDGTVQFTYTLLDSDGDSDTAVLSIKVSPDGEPIIVSGENTVDETALDLGPLIINDSLDVDFGLDGAGNVNPNGITSFGGSATAGNLTSDGTPVVMQATATGYEGVLQGTTTQVFELILQDNGDYSFELFGPLDHADASDPNDAIQLNFGVTASDFGGDTDEATITINVLDDAPVAHDDCNDFNIQATDKDFNIVMALDVSGSMDGAKLALLKASVTNLLTDFSDYTGGEIKVHLVPFAGNAGAGQTFTVTDQAGFDAAIAYLDGLSAGGYTNYEAPLQSAISWLEGDSDNDPIAGGETYTYFISDGEPNRYLDNNGDVEGGDANTVIDEITGGDGTNEVEILQNLSNEVIGVGIGVDGATLARLGIIDSDGVALDVQDPTDLDSALQGTNPLVGTATGNVITGLNGGAGAADDTSEDLDNTVTSVTFNGTTVVVDPVTGASIDGTFGTLQINADGSYTYQVTAQNLTGSIVENFTYVLTDGDGDQSEAELTLKGAYTPVDDEPEIGDADKTVDETDLGPVSVTGTIASDFGADGPGTITPTGAGSFTASGSVAGGTLTSGGIPVTVTVTGDTYTGTAGGDTIFTLVVENDGDFTFNLIGILDHADTTDPDDIIDLSFGVTGEDDDGDTDTGTIVIHVKDDGPYINTKFKPIDESDLDGVASISYTHTLDFDFGSDGAGTIEPTGNFTAAFQVGGNNQPLTAGGAAITVSATATGYEGTLAGGEVVFDLVIDPTSGEYTYTQYQAVDHPDDTDHDDVIWLKFEVQIVDADGDTDTAIIGVDLHDDGPVAHDDIVKVGQHDRTVGGNIIDNDEVGADVDGSIANLIHDGMSYPIPVGGAVILAGDYGKLTVESDGTYTYERTTNNPGLESFQYTLQDGDGDTDVASLDFNVHRGCIRYSDDDQILKGTDGDDLVVGNDYDNVIDAGAGDNLIYGGSGADTFLFKQADVDASVDRVADFNSGEGDVIDLSDFLHSFDPVTEAIEDFVFQREVGGDTVISVDTSGSGDVNNAVDLVVLENISGEDLDQLVLNAQTTI